MKKKYLGIILLILLQIKPGSSTAGTSVSAGGDTLNLIKEIMQSDVKFILDEQRIRPANSEVFRLWGENALIRKLTGFEPQFNIRKGLEITCDWFTKSGNLSKYKANIYNV